MTYIPPNPLQEKMNQKMTEYVPELDSEYALTPMSNGFSWRRTSSKLDDGRACFIQHAGDLSQIHETPVKKDYIWIPGDVHKELLAGYYHLSTKEAYREVLRRMLQKDKERKNSNLNNALKLKFRSKDQKEDDRVTRKVLSLIRLRLKSLEPNDVHATTHKTTTTQKKYSNVSATTADMVSAEFTLLAL